MNNYNLKLPKIATEEIQHLKGTLKGTPFECVLSREAPKVKTAFGEVQMGSVLSYQVNNIKIIQVPDFKGCGNTSVHNTSPVSLSAEHQELNNGSADIDVHFIEQSTRDQANSDQWFKARSCRLTASNFGRVLKRKATLLKNSYAVFFCQNKSLSAPALDYGRRNEKNAKAKYLEKYPSRHFHECGLVINKEFCFLGATPDGRVCDDGKSGIAEIKCPYTARNYTIKEAFDKLDNFCLQMDQTTELFLLKKDHGYYAHKYRATL